MSNMTLEEMEGVRNQAREKQTANQELYAQQNPDVAGLGSGAFKYLRDNSRIPDSPIRQNFMSRNFGKGWSPDGADRKALLNDRTQTAMSSPLRDYFDEKRNPPPKTQQEMDLEAFGQAVQNGLFKNMSMGFNAGTTKPATTGGLAAEALKGITSGTGGNAMAPQPQAAQPIQGASPGMQAPAPQVQQAPVMYQGKPAEGGGGQPVDIQTLLAPGLEAWQKAQDTGGDPSTWHKGLSLGQLMTMGRGLKTAA